MIYTKMMGFVPTQDLEKARAFYEGLLGLRSVSEDQFALVLDANGTMIRVTKVTDFKPQPLSSHYSLGMTGMRRMEPE